ncbi:MAG: hypothetical protein KA368_07655 [Acidobacteria bacterium]|nr:hypothetical protein [Acidobacteriota bacterium]
MKRIKYFGQNYEGALKNRTVIPSNDDCPFTSISNPYVDKTTPASPQRYIVNDQAVSTGTKQSTFITIRREVIGQRVGAAKISMVRNQSQVDDFLATRIFLIQIIREACEQIEKCFGPDPSLVLETSIDPEDGSPSLLLLIQTSKRAVEALPMLDRFDEDWWFDNADRARGLLTIKLEYV